MPAAQARPVSAVLDVFLESLPEQRILDAVGYELASGRPLDIASDWKLSEMNVLVFNQVRSMFSCVVNQRIFGPPLFSTR